MAFSLLGTVALCAVIAQTRAAEEAAPAARSRPDLSGYWNPSNRGAPDKALMSLIPPNTVLVDDTGAVELPRGDYGGLKLKPKALAEAQKWDPKDDMSLVNACKPPSIIYAMQGPFPMEIYQGTELIVIKLEYFDLIRVVFMDGRPHPGAEYPNSKLGFSTGRWDGNTLVVETSHLAHSTITNNGLNHSDKVKVIERFRLSEDGTTLLSTQEFEDPEMLDNRGARFIAWKRRAGEHVYPYDCDPTFALEYQKN